ncbi:hypothetical protein [Saccharopolyspora sp. NPDC002376]
MDSSAAKGILSIGLDPGDLDYTRYPDLDEAALRSRIESANADLRESGFDVVPCLVPADPDEAAVKVRERVAAGAFRVAMIGGAVRMAPEHTLLFERLVNVLNETCPGIVFCFNTSPETTIDALRRWA